MKTRLHELSLLHWAVFMITVPLTSFVIATQPDNPLPLFMMIVLITGFVRIVGRLTETR